MHRLIPLMEIAVMLPLSLAIYTDNGRLTIVDGINYYIDGLPVSRLSVPLPLISTWIDAGFDLIPVTVVQSRNANFTWQDMQETISRFTMEDDVFQPGFLEAIFLNHAAYNQGYLINAHNLSAYGNINKKVIFATPGYHSRDPIVQASLDGDVPEGPYFLAVGTGALYQAFRLYPDHQLAFTEAAVSDGNGGFRPLPAVTEGAMTKAVAVPSRLYFTPSPNKPLAGLRLGIKDIFDLAGLRTGGGNRAFYNLYPPRNTTAPAIQRLIDAGAIVVGKMGTVQFANGDNPTADWVDFHCPFNPRGDGYQSPGGSSSGPASGIASYEWLDIAVGSDTGGSMRNPAGLQGIYGNRPSTGAVAIEGVLPLCDVLDTAGVFARDARTLSTVLHAWYQDSDKAYKGYPRRLFYSNASFPDSTTEAGALLEEVVAGIEGFLRLRREVVDTPSRWAETHPSGTPSNITELLNTTYAILTSVHQYKTLALPFFTDYAAKHNGSQPYINPGPRVRWAWGQENGGDTGYEMALRNKTIFKDWWESHGYGVPNEDTCSEGIYIYPYSTGKTQYRDVYTSAPTKPPMGFKDGRIATMAGVPDVVVPVGEVSYASTVSLRTEYMPVTMSLVAARGCDLMLASLVRDLEKAGILKAVGTGSRMYE